MANFKRIVLHRLLVGGQPIAFEDGQVEICGERITVDHWLELRRRIDLLFQRASLLTPLQVAPPGTISFKPYGTVKVI